MNVRSINRCVELSIQVAIEIIPLGSCIWVTIPSLTRLHTYMPYAVRGKTWLVSLATHQCIIRVRLVELECKVAMLDLLDWLIGG